MQNCSAPQDKAKDFQALYASIVQNTDDPAKVPTIIDGGAELTESLVVVEYLDQKYGGDSPLLPHDPLQRAKAGSTPSFLCCLLPAPCMHAWGACRLAVLSFRAPARARDLVIETVRTACMLCGRDMIGGLAWPRRSSCSWSCSAASSRATCSRC